jgi:broad specificity phosphatase PhoE
MYKLIILIFAVFLISCKTTKYFIVRHAEKETTNTMTSDVPLSEAGKQRALALKDLLRNEKLSQIYSTNYIRTKTTAQPLADALALAIQTYNPSDSAFVKRMRSIPNANILIVGHSNTVDDLVNNISGERLIAGDLPDTQYGDLFIIRKKGTKIKYEVKHFGK